MTSTLKFNRWENAAGQGIADAASGALSLGRNLLYNGAMQVAQRGTSATALGNGDNGYHTADRWAFGEGGSPTFEFTQTMESDGPTGSGFTKSLKMECTTADASLAASDLLLIEQKLEGQDLQGLKKGTSDAESLTLSFWVKSNVTGTYVAQLYDNDNTRQICLSYSISASATWEKKTITFAGDTTGAFDNDNERSLLVRFFLAAGSDYTSGTLATSWASVVNANLAVGQTNLAASTSNYWQVTGVQLETGTVATGFDHKPYGVELAECQRYLPYFAGTINLPGYGELGSNYFHVSFPVEARVAPTGLVVSSGTGFRINIPGVGNPTTTSVILSGAQSPQKGMIKAVSSGSNLGNSDFGNLIGLTSGAYIYFTGCEL